MQLVDIFLDPAKVFAAEKEKPTFLLPALALIAVSAAAILAYHFRVDPAWFSDFQVTMIGRDMTAAEVAQIRPMLPSAHNAGYLATAFVLIFLPIMLVVTAVYYLLAGKVAGAPVTFKHGLSLAAWASVPAVLAGLVGLVGAFTMAPQTAQHTLMLTRVDPLLVQLPLEHDLSSLAKSFDLLSFWSIALGAIGWKTFTRSGWGAAIVVAALPSVLIYGIWLLIALL